MINYIQKIGLIVLLLLSFGCKKEESGIPNVRVEFTVFLDDPQYSALKSIGGHGILDNYGVAGIVIYNTGSGYVAFDRCSTVNPEKRCAVILDKDSGFDLIDPCSGGKFSLMNGFPSKAPAKKALKQYRVAGQGPNVLRITNY